jgi:hypothetical protein
MVFGGWYWRFEALDCECAIQKVESCGVVLVLVVLREVSLRIGGSLDDALDFHFQQRDSNLITHELLHQCFVAVSQGAHKSLLFR